VKRNKRTFLNLEALEDRWVPATVQFTSGYLFISPSSGESALSLTVTQTTPNAFSVQDKTSTLGTFSRVGNLNITGGNGADSVTINLNNNRYTGNLFVSTGNGNDTVNVTDGGATTFVRPFQQTTGGAILGTTQILPGVGNDSVSWAARGRRPSAGRSR
jgi:hypothetical protein